MAETQNMGAAERRFYVIELRCLGRMWRVINESSEELGAKENQVC